MQRYAYHQIMKHMHLQEITTRKPAYVINWLNTSHVEYVYFFSIDVQIIMMRLVP